MGISAREKYEEEYEKISKYIQKNKDRKILFIELGVGRMTPMFIQEPFWELTNSLKDAYYISVNSEYQFLPEFIEDKGIAILGDIGTVLKDLQKAKEKVHLYRILVLDIPLDGEALEY